mmetsp:Transcript_25640/g.75813  ORF Transcript_25640/g.75813 Transcript_25640/m.75813 type:complete len:232 (-) Transcript_25640:1066-1761(-)
MDSLLRSATQPGACCSGQSATEVPAGQLGLRQRCAAERLIVPQQRLLQTWALSGMLGSTCGVAESPQDRLRYRCGHCPATATCCFPNVSRPFTPHLRRLTCVPLCQQNVCHLVFDSSISTCTSGSTFSEVLSGRSRATGMAKADSRGMDARFDSRTIDARSMLTMLMASCVGLGKLLGSSLFLLLKLRAGSWFSTTGRRKLNMRRGLVSLLTSSNSQRKKMWIGTATIAPM